MPVFPPPLAPPAKGGEFCEMPNYRFLPLDGGGEVGVKGVPRAVVPGLWDEEKNIDTQSVV